MQIITKAKTIEISYDTESDKKDKYNRDLVWVYVDGELLQNKLIERGYGEVNNAKKSFKHTDMLCASEKIAVDGKVGIWESGTETEDYCKSGLVIKTTKKTVKVTTKKEEKTETPYKLILVCLIGIVLLSLLYVRGKKHEKE